MAFTERAETAAVSCGTSHASAVSIILSLRWIFQNALSKASHSCRLESQARAVSLLESGEQRYYKSDQQLFYDILLPITAIIGYDIYLPKLVVLVTL